MVCRAVRLTPEAQGMDTALLDQADAWVRANSPNRYSFLVVRNGYLVYERYYNGAGPYSPYHIASISKSFLSALTGIAMERGVVTLEDRWFDTFPEYAAVADPRTLDLRLRNMLIMSTGLDWSDNDIITKWYATPSLYPDWIAFTLTRNCHDAPGERFWYNTGNTHMLSAFLTRKTGQTTYDFARANLLAPIGISMGDWWRDFSPYHYYTGGFGMHVTPRDLAKFGYLYLRGGDWDGRRVVPADWVRESTAPHIRHNSGADDFYGYLWWMDNLRGFFVPSARGMGNQRVWYSRELDLVVVSTGDYNGSSPDPTPLVRDYAIPSAYRGTPLIGAVVNAASSAPALAPDSFATVYGENLAPAAADWSSVVLDGRTLPATLAGVQVKVAGQSAWVSYSSPLQVNILLPPGLPAGPADFEISHPGGTARTTVTIAPVSPALFTYPRDGGNWAAALYAGTARLVDAARAGDNLELYAEGLGATAESHPEGEVLARPYAHAAPASVQVVIGGMQAEVQAVNMTYAGVWQVNVKMPAGVAAGAQQITVRAGGETSPPALLPVAAP